MNKYINELTPFEKLNFVVVDVYLKDNSYKELKEYFVFLCEEFFGTKEFQREMTIEFYYISDKGIFFKRFYSEERLPGDYYLKIQEISKMILKLRLDRDMQTKTIIKEKVRKI